MTNCGIACDLHDYLEIACLYHYDIKLTLKDGHIIDARAKDTRIVDKREYLVVERQGETQQIDVLSLKKLQVLTANAPFKVVDFA